jgi:serine/threonine-protein kinase
MTPERWKRVKQLFASALERRAEERDAFLDEACAGDAPLRREVDSLLAADGEPGPFLESVRLDLADAPAARASLALAPGRRLGPYEIVALLGAGGMGEVYRARDTRLGREVALKVLPQSAHDDADRLRRFDEEARAASALNHPNVLTVYDVGAEAGVRYVVSELLEGQTLRQRLAAGRLAPRQSLDYARQIVAGLAAAHGKGIVHRDLKPENLFLTEDGRIKILDFGLAKRTRPRAESEAATASRHTQPGTLMGTLGYMSPEQLRGLRADRRSDVFSLGLVLYEMLAGRRAFARGSEAETTSAILRDDPEPLPLNEIPVEIDAVVRRCLEKEPEGRFESARELALALETAAQGLGPAVAQEPAPRHSVAVLPLLNMTGDPEQEYFCEGIAEELINALGKVEGLRLAARSSSFRFDTKADSLARIGAELKVDKLLEGSVRRAGNRLRVTVQLVDVQDGAHLWSERYDRDVQDVFALQDEIASSVVEALRLKLEPRRGRRETDDVEAYQLYLKGLHFWNKRHEGGLQQGIKAFEKAIERDPAYAPAYAGLADSYGVLGLSIYDGLPAREAMPKARAAALRALEIDPGLAAPHAALGWVRLHFEWDWPAAEADFRRALAVDPRRATSRHWFGFLLSAMGRSDEALAEARRAWELDPLSLIINAQLCQAHYYAGRFEETATAARKVLEMEPGFAVGHFWLGVASAAQGSFERALAGYEAFASGGGGRTRALALLGNARARAGEPEAARRTLAELREIAARRPVPAYHFALVHVGLGERDEAFAWLERAHQERSDQMAYLGVEPLLDPLRADPRFDALLRSLRLPFARRAAPAEAAPRAPRERRSVAVLPFRDLAGEAGSAHLGLGLADATITELARLRSLVVRPTSAILRYQERPVDARQAARELDVDAVVDGSFQRTGSRLRVTVRLVDARDGGSLWAGKVDASLDDVFQMQDEVSRAVARALEVELTPSEERRREGPPPARPGAEAHEMYLKGKVHLFGESLSDFVTAIDWFEKAREREPGFALAWAGLADAYARMAFTFKPEGDWYARAWAMCEKALSLDPSLPEGRYVRARLRWTPQHGFDHAGAIRDLVPALQERPSLENGYVLLGIVLHHVGLLEEARRLFEQAEAVSPGHPRARSHVVMSLLGLGRYEEGLELAGSIAPGVPLAFFDYCVGLCRAHLGRLDDAESAAADIARQAPDEILAHPLRAVVAALRGDGVEAERQVRLVVENRKAYGHYHHAQYDVACAWSLLGRPETALEWLGDAARNGYPCVSQFERDEFLDPLRGSARFERLMDELRAGRDRYSRLYEELRGGAAPHSSGRPEAPPVGRAPAGRIMLAVLPFENWSRDPEQEYFSDGLTEELIAQLGRLGPERLGVIARTSAMTYKHTRKGIDTIGRELGVDYVLEGSARSGGRALRVSARLILVRDQSQVWSATYERDLTDVLAVQDELGRAVAAEIGVRLAPRGITATAAQPLDMDAYQAHLRGRHCWNKRTVEGFQKAIECFQEAIAIAPGYAPAHVGLADSYALLGDVGVAALPPKQAFAKARASLARAIELDEGLADAHASLAHLHMHAFAWREAEREFARALELNPSYATAHHWHALFLAAMECHTEAQAAMRRAQQLDPLSLAIGTDAGVLLYYARRFEEAAAQYRRTLEMDPGFARAHATLGSTYGQMGRHEEAVAAVRKANELSPGAARKAALARALAASGKTREALAILEELEELSKCEYVAPYPLALVNVALGRIDEAFALLEKARVEAASDILYVKVDPWLDPVRADPRYPSLLEGLGLSPVHGS